MKILKFYSATCGPCKVLEKNLQQTDIPYESIDVSSEIGIRIASQFGVHSVPTLIAVDNTGTVKASHVGLMTVDKLKKWYEEIVQVSV